MKIIKFLRKILAYLLVHEFFTCYVYESTLTVRNEDEFKPGTSDFTLKIVSTEEQLNELVNSGFDLSPHFKRAKYRIEKGAAACFVFSGKELASMEWAAMNAQAKAGIDIYPCKVDFTHNEAYAGGVWTNLKYRGQGLHTYVYYKIYDFLRENGITSVKSIVEVNNTAALKAHEKFAPEEKITARAHYIRFLGLRYWRETPYEPTDKKPRE